LPEKIYHFFQRGDQNLINLAKDASLSELTDILPAHLKSQVHYYLFKDAINVISVFKNKEQRFYSQFM